MKNQKRNIKNRIKGFFTDSTKYSRNRIEGDEASPSIQEINDKWNKDKQNLQDPEEEADHS